MLASALVYIYSFCLLVVEQDILLVLRCSVKPWELATGIGRGVMFESMDQGDEKGGIQGFEMIFFSALLVVLRKHGLLLQELE